MAGSSIGALGLNSEMLLGAKESEEVLDVATTLADAACLELFLALAASSAATDFASLKLSNMEIAYVTVVSAFAQDASKYATVSVVVFLVYVEPMTVGGKVVDLKLLAMLATMSRAEVRCGH